MVNKKLQSIGGKLNVSKKDISEIKKERIKGKFLYPIIGFIIVVCSTIAGLFIGEANAGCTNCAGYPFSFGGLYSGSLLTITKTSKKEKSLLFLLITLIATFFYQ